MSSLRSLAFILASVIRRARALSCSALHSVEKERTMATKRGKNMATNMAASMSVSYEQPTPVQKYNQSKFRTLPDLRKLERAVDEEH